MNEGFFVIYDIATGKFLSGQDLTLESLVDLGTKVALYRSKKSAISSARKTVEYFKYFIDKSTDHKGSPSWEYFETNYLRKFSGVKVCPVRFLKPDTNDLSLEIFK